jgi:hypothetical protein
VREVAGLYYGFNFGEAQAIAVFGVPPSGGALVIAHRNRLKAGLRTGAQSAIGNRQSEI